MTDQNRLISDQKLTSDNIILQIVSALAVAIIVLLVVGFFKGWFHSFYASLLFGYYALTHQIWISVVLLGVTQTFLMIPFRIIRVIQSQNIIKFQDKVAELKSETQQIARVKKTFSQGNLTLIFYVIDFMVQLVLFVSIGRLFLTDFYQQPLDPDVLFKFIPYPEYPLQGLMFKIPYPVVLESKTFGWGWLFLVWILILLAHVFIYLAKRLQKKLKADREAKAALEAAKKNEDDEEVEKIVTKPKQAGAQALSVLGSSTIVLFILSYFLVRHFPTLINFRIFSGDVSIPNRTLNTVTAVATFVLFVWFGLQDIARQSKLAKEQGISKNVIELTQKEMFSSTLLNSTLIGLGAFFITNLIPSAFELSIFTFEIIALLSPLTLDRFILKIRS